MYPEMNKTKAGLVIKVLFTPLGVGLSLERIKAPGEVRCKGAVLEGAHPSNTEGMNLEE